MSILSTTIADALVNTRADALVHSRVNADGIALMKNLEPVNALANSSVDTLVTTSMSVLLKFFGNALVL